MSENIKLASYYMLIASFSFALMGAFVKIASQSINTVEIVLFRNLFGLIVLVVSLKAIPLSQKGGKPYLLFFRGLIGTLALFAVFYNLAHISLAKAVTFVQTSPIFVALFALIFLKERLDRVSLMALFAGFIGILFITKPEGFMLSKYDILGIFSGVFAALAYTSIRELKKYYDTRVIVLSFLVSGTIVPFVGLLFGEFFGEIDSLDFIIAPFVMPLGIDWIWLFGVGFFALIGQLYLTKAYSCAKAGIVATVGYSNIAFAALLGYMLGDMMPDFYTMIGIVIIVICGIVVSRR